MTTPCLTQILHPHELSPTLHVHAVVENTSGVTVDVESAQHANVITIEGRDPCVGDTWYRVHEFGGSIHCAEFRVTRVTPRTVILIELPDYGIGQPRRCVVGANKSYARPTIEQAWESFVIRKKRHLKHLRRMTQYIEDVLRLAEHAQASNVLPSSKHPIYYWNISPQEFSL